MSRDIELNCLNAKHLIESIPSSSAVEEMPIVGEGGQVDKWKRLVEIQKIQQHQQQQYESRQIISVENIVKSESEEVYFNKSYSDGFSRLSQIFYWHICSFMLKAKYEIINQKEKLSLQYLPQLSEEQHVDSYFQLTISLLSANMSGSGLLKLLYLRVFRYKVSLVLVNFVIESACRCGTSLLMSSLIAIVLESGDYWEMVGYGIGLSVVMIVGVICKHYGQHLSYEVSGISRMTIGNLIQWRLSGMSKYSMQCIQMGRVINMLAGDSINLENNLVIAFNLVTVPISVVFIVVVLSIRYGVGKGLIGLGVLCLCLPIQRYMQYRLVQYLMGGKQTADVRIQRTGEVVENIRTIKMYAWERRFQECLIEARGRESEKIGLIYVIQLLDRAINSVSQVWASLLFFLIMYYGVEHPFKAQNMITTIQLMTFFKSNIGIPMSASITSLIQFRNGFNRIANLLMIKESKMIRISNPLSDGISGSPDNNSIVYQNFYSYWSANGAILKNISLTIQQGTLNALVGQYGCGKTTFLHSLMMEIPNYSGSLKIIGYEAFNPSLKIAIVEQQPKTFPDTIINNILFGSLYDQSLYQLVIKVTHLEKDIQNLPNGDQTRVGENGIQLSVGQMARISLARALYSLSDIYLLDDPFSAVDAKVLSLVFHQAIKYFIMDYQMTLHCNKIKPIVIIATHQMECAFACDQVIVLNKGMVSGYGKYNQIKDKLNMIEHKLSSQYALEQEDRTEPFTPKRFRQSTNNQPILSRQNIDHQTEQFEDVDWNVYALILGKQSIFITLLFLAAEIVINLYYRYVAMYNELESVTFFIIISVLGTLSLLINVIKYMVNSFHLLKRNSQLHNDSIVALLNSKAEYTVQGRLLNIFSSDLCFLDYSLYQAMNDIYEMNSFYLVTSIYLFSIIPWFSVITFITVLIYISLYRFSKDFIIQSKNCDLIQRTPFYAALKVTMNGILQIKQYQQAKTFNRKFINITNDCIRANITYYFGQRFFSFYIEFVGTIASIIGILILIHQPFQSDSDFIQSLFLLVIFNDSQQWCLRQTIIVHSLMSSAKRLIQITQSEQEVSQELPVDQLLHNWPRTGEIEFKNVSMRYRRNADLLLRNISFKVLSGENLGCVGRTGSGKSSILQALFRINQIENSDDQSGIFIDAQNTAAIGLRLLRKSIAYIPQVPFIFSGTVRQNLDPFHVINQLFNFILNQKFTDTQIWKTLKEARLFDVVKSMKNELETEITDHIFSVGQKQLICLARVILNKRQIIVMDEASASVDMKTDAFVQAKIKEKFQNCTIITIAHRLTTVADYDKIIVIDNGRVVEFASPLELLEKREESVFAEMVKQTGHHTSNLIYELAQNANKRKIQSITLSKSCQ